MLYVTLCYFTFYYVTLLLISYVICYVTFALCYVTFGKFFYNKLYILCYDLYIMSSYFRIYTRYAALSYFIFDYVTFY